MNNSTTIVVLAHKSKDLVLEFIKVIYNNYNIIIIENSNDIFLEKEIKKNYPNILIKLIDNNGYGSAVNYACKLVKTDYFLISNPDIQGLNEKNIKKFIESAKILKDNFSSLGPRFLNADPKSHIQSNPDKEIAEMKFISGSCMFFKKEIFTKHGGFDENIFLYFEETDYCLRSYKKKKNYQINSIKVTHISGSSVTSENDLQKKKLEELRSWHFIWSKFYYYKKHYGFLLAFLYFIPIITRTLVKIVFHKIKKNNAEYEKYCVRLSGLINSIKGNKSHKRINK